MPHKWQNAGTTIPGRQFPNCPCTRRKQRRHCQSAPVVRKGRGLQPCLYVDRLAPDTPTCRSFGARDSRHGLRGKPVKRRCCPRNCKRQARLRHATGAIPGKASQAKTREPGNLPGRDTITAGGGPGGACVLRNPASGRWFACPCPRFVEDRKGDTSMTPADHHAPARARGLDHGPMGPAPAAKATGGKDRDFRQCQEIR
ncbi:hypothetical protein EV656_103320 [Rhodovulum adriaticum]|uniref:Uncharacterized protein n=1 Tax=Rhodovulum adriaticum TaxID=35804 RepID=A0A4R2NUG0_RHOAD|nr:hypothetical protein EV656_103320 [Rhodovulum adriaticum]